MKLGELRSFGHNLADSLSSGMCLMIGIYVVDIYKEAAASPQGHIVVDFLTGQTTGSPISSALRGAVQRYAEDLPRLCNGHGIDRSEIKRLSARFGTDKVAGPHFSVIVESTDGRQSTDRYVGFPGRRY